MNQRSKIKWEKTESITDPSIRKARESYRVAEWCRNSNMYNSAANRMFYSVYQCLFAVICKDWIEIYHPRKGENLSGLIIKHCPNFTWDDDLHDLIDDLYNNRKVGDYYREDVNSEKIDMLLDDYEQLIKKCVEFVEYAK